MSTLDSDPRAPRGSAEPGGDPSPAPNRRPSGPPTVRSYLGPGCVFEGEFKGRGSLECHGRLNGRVEIDVEIVVGERGCVKADLVAGTVRIQGRLKGNVTGAEKVVVGETGHVRGDIHAPAVAFAEGAFFEGNVEMRSVGRKNGAG